MSNRLTESNIKDYLSNNPTSISLTSSSTLDQFCPLLQSDYGEPQDCTLTSITVCLYNELKTVQPQEIYDIVERIAKSYFYNGYKWGTLPIFIKNILDRAKNHFNLFPKSKVRYLKNLFFKFDTISEIIDSKKPVILSLLNDGRDYYKSHTVTVVGYAVYRVDGTEKKLLKIYDNWTRQISYIDYDLLSLWSCINF